MKSTARKIVYDEILKIEAFHLKGVFQPFPNHFYEYYVIGLIERGKRKLFCRGREYLAAEGDILLFHPGDNHACTQEDEEELDYRGLNISPNIMSVLVEELTGRPELPGFSQNLIRDQETACCLKNLQELLMAGKQDFGKEEKLLLLLELLLQKYRQIFSGEIPLCQEEIQKACRFMEENLDKPLSLEQICRHTGLGKSTLLRAFTREKGITPYRYLETLRINKARKLLEEGRTLTEAALETGFSDQSHFTNYFTSFTGISPGSYRNIYQIKEGWEKEKSRLKERIGTGEHGE